MCGIVGYVGPNVDGHGPRRRDGGARPPRVPRLRLRRRRPRRRRPRRDRSKRAGKLGNLRDGHRRATRCRRRRTGIGHTRWATHGGPTDDNAHPHRGGEDGKLALIHNGIIENFHSLKAELVADGRQLHVARPTPRSPPTCSRAAYDATHDLTEAMRLRRRTDLEGAFTLLAIHADAPGVVVGARRNSPLVVGLGDGENFLGSDVAAFIGHTRDALELGQDQIVDDHARRRSASSTSTARPAEGKPYDVDWDAAAAEKGGYPTFMDEGDPRAAARGGGHPARAHRRPGGWCSTSCGSPRRALRNVDKIVVIACGTAAYAGHGRASTRSSTGPASPCEVELAHEFRYRDPVDRRAHARRVDQPVRRDDGHADGRQARPRAGRR